MLIVIGIINASPPSDLYFRATISQSGLTRDSNIALVGGIIQEFKMIARRLFDKF